MMPDDDQLGYADAAQVYWDRGWRGVLPLTRGTKWPPPGKRKDGKGDTVGPGFTGYEGVDPSYPDLLQWMELYPTGNICLRLPDGVVGIDVDAYGAKSGAAAFTEAVRRWGPLPDGPTSSSRDDDRVSGLRLFRVPPGTLLETVIVFPELSIGDIEVIQRHHRYVVCWPSIHPEGRGYWWRDAAWQPSSVPSLDEVPDLPTTWLDALKLTPRSLDFVGEGYDTRQALTAGEPSLVVSARLAMAIKELNLPGQSRHDTCLRHVMAILRHGAEGQPGVEQALGLLREVFVAVVTMDGSRTRDVAVVEFNRMVTNNNVARELSQPGILDWFRQVMESSRSELNTSPPSPTEDDPGPQSANANRAEDVGVAAVPLGDAQPEPPEPSSVGELEALEQDFWTARESHKLIFNAALSGMVSPWAVLGCCAARALALVPVRLWLPGLVGNRGSLNWFTAIVGRSGDGKGAAMSLSGRLVPDEMVVRPIGSGEGMIECYNRTPPKGDDPPRPVESVLFEVAEVDALGAMMGRSGQTTMSMIKQGFSAELLALAYRGRQGEAVLPNTYRMTVIAAVQPSRAGTLLDDDGGGTPQRFMWFPGLDKRITDEEIPWPVDNLGRPRTLSDNFPRRWDLDRASGEISIPDEARALIRRTRAARARGERSVLDGHALFCREKLAFALAWMDGRLEIDSEDWRLSGIAADVSDWQRERVVAEYRESKADESRDRGALKGVESAAAERGKIQEQQDGVQRVLKRVLDKISQAGPSGLSNRDLSRGIAYRDQDMMKVALEYAQGQGLIMQVEGTTTWVMR